MGRKQEGQFDSKRTKDIDPETIGKKAKNRSPQSQRALDEELRHKRKQQFLGCVALLFMFGVGAAGVILQIYEAARGDGATRIDFQDTASLKKVLFSGEPWLIYCIDNSTARYPLPKVIQEGSSELWSTLGMQVGVLNCFDKTSSGRSVAERFKMKRTPPLSFVVANGNNPRVFSWGGVSKPEDIIKKVQPALVLSQPQIKALKSWPSYCTSKKSCVVVGHKNDAQRTHAKNVIKGLQEQHRTLKVVLLDTSFWALKLEEQLLASRKGKSSGATLVCLTRKAPEDGGKNTTFAGSLLTDVDASSAATFFKNCADQKDQVPLKAAPKISARSRKEKAKVVTPEAWRDPSPPPSKRTKPAPPPPEKGNVDRVGSRDAIQDEDPLFWSAEEDAEDKEEPEDSSAPEEEVEL
eukprot:TRINITY_DN16820_c0_g1_i1.p1 TRINITY_DN16820_c0_g1~~TRINITY_DN16820_c0_g1_i1.p1  ORF type:complete len:408 (+),score=87.82 TRINITY_DN16820_c0_g1_i1:79-1302(+)